MVSVIAFVVSDGTHLLAGLGPGPFPGDHLV